MAGGLFGGGDGSVGTPYLVEDAQDLDRVRSNLSACYLQTSDIDLLKAWEPIGPTFSGSYDGGLHVIDFDGAKTTLFVFLKNATISNVGIEHADVPPFVTCESGLAGSSESSVFLNCFVSGHSKESGFEVVFASHTEGDEDDWVCRSRHPFYKEKILRSSKQKRKGEGICRQRGASCAECPTHSQVEDMLSKFDD